MKKEDSRVFFFQMGGGGFVDIANSSANPRVSKGGDADCDANHTVIATELMQVIARWEHLPKPIQQAILLLAASDSKDV